MWVRKHGLLLAWGTLVLQSASGHFLWMQVLGSSWHLNSPVAAFRGALVHGKLAPGCGLHGLDHAVLVFEHNRLRRTLRASRVPALFELRAQVLRVLDDARGRFRLARMHQPPRVLHRCVDHGVGTGTSWRAQALVVGAARRALVSDSWRVAIVGYRRLQVLRMTMMAWALGGGLWLVDEDVEILIKLVSSRYMHFWLHVLVAKVDFFNIHEVDDFLQIDLSLFLTIALEFLLVLVGHLPDCLAH